MDDAKGEFFMVDRSTWSKVIRVRDERKEDPVARLNAALAYLVIACGTGKDNAASRWSVDAIRRYTGMGLSRAQRARDALVTDGLVKVAHRGKSKHSPPRYTLVLPKTPDWIWIPNALVRGAGYGPPLARLKGTQDPMTLRLLVDMYGAHELTEDGGVPRSATYGKWDREEWNRRGEWTVWAFNRGGNWVWWDHPWVVAHQRPDLPREKQGTDWFRRVDQLVGCGLAEWVPTLFESDSPEADAVVPLEDPALRELAWEASVALLDGRHLGRDPTPELLIPMQRHVGNVTVVGVLRLTFRPHTRKTAAWWAERRDAEAAWADAYREILRRFAPHSPLLETG